MIANHQMNNEIKLVIRITIISFTFDNELSYVFNDGYQCAFLPAVRPAKSPSQFKDVILPV